MLCKKSGNPPKASRLTGRFLTLLWLRHKVKLADHWNNNLRRIWK